MAHRARMVGLVKGILCDDNDEPGVVDDAPPSAAAVRPGWKLAFFAQQVCVWLHTVTDPLTPWCEKTVPEPICTLNRM